MLPVGSRRPPVAAVQKPVRVVCGTRSTIVFGGTYAVWVAFATVLNWTIWRMN